MDQAPIRFYFEHRQRIEEWAALKTQAAAYGKTLLDEMGEELPVPDGALLHWDRGGSYEGVILYRPEWRVTTDRPPAGIGIGWASKPNIGQPDGANGPWWGIWRGQTAQDDPLASMLKSELRTATAPLGLKLGSFSWWPFWKEIPPPPEGWYDELAAWSEMLHTLVLKAWNDLANPLGQIIAASTEELVFPVTEEQPADQ